ncbi:MAG: VWA domain-containing protein [Kofleriaceae bacterium]|nr:VWA domain-containing protein [Kofleriaceae bacterium]
MSRLLVASLLTTSALLAPRAAAADNCSPARVMVVLDKSSSMVTGMVGADTKWDIARGGLGNLLDTYGTKAEFGLMTFPKPNQCGPGSLDVAPSLDNKTSIVNALGAPPPTSGNYTPMAQSLEAAAAEPSMQASRGPRHVVLITDGWQYCVPYDPQTRFDGTDAIAALNAKGITTWIVGFGAEVDAAALNQMALAAGTAKTGCDPTSEDPAAPNNCYFQVDNATELNQALSTIGGSVSAEICDGIDNDCDGLVDEDVTRSCSTACGAGTETCSAGTWGACDAPQPTTETCDGDDNDCDGEVDEDDSGLCSGEEVCTDGSCQPPNGEGESEGGMHAGCACDSSQAPGAGSFAMFGLLGALLLRRRRR